MGLYDELAGTIEDSISAEEAQELGVNIPEED